MTAGEAQEPAGPGGVLIYVQHLLGVGHLRRALLLARAVAGRGTAVHVLRGGTPAPYLDPGDARVVPLPALRSADERFSALVDGAGRPLDERFKAHRRDDLLRHFLRLRPRVLVLETYPFGRRQLRFELLPLLEAARAARPRPWVVCSVRDILQAREPRRSEETVELLGAFFDHVLVHGDPAFVRFEETFPAAARIPAGLHYTGLVAESAAAFAPPGPAQSGVPAEVIVSAGGGAVSARLLATAARARALSASRGRTWRLLAGPNLEQGVFDALARELPAGVKLERARADFARLLAGCAVSVSQAGYNTVTDLLRARAPCVLVPYRGQGQSEQTLRAARLAARGLAQVVDEGDLSPHNLALAVDAAIDAPRPVTAVPDLEGAEKSAALIGGWLREAPNPRARRRRPPPNPEPETRNPKP